MQRQVAKEAQSVEGCSDKKIWCRLLTSWMASLKKADNSAALGLRVNKTGCERNSLNLDSKQHSNRLVSMVTRNKWTTSIFWISLRTTFTFFDCNGLGRLRDRYTSKQTRVNSFSLNILVTQKITCARLIVHFTTLQQRCRKARISWELNAYSNVKIITMYERKN